MPPEKIRVLGIAPYEGMKSSMLKLVKERDDIDLTVYVGDLQKGAEIAQKSFHGNYDVIISRGGTAELIGTITQVPVIEITLSVYDILRAIKLAENFDSSYAIVGFPGIASVAQLLCDLLQYKVEVFTIHSGQEVQPLLNNLKKRGYRMVLCDMIANTTAKKLGLNAILITSGNESIANAFDQAVKLFKAHASLREENIFFNEILRKAEQQTIVFMPNGEVFFSTLARDSNHKLIELLKKELVTADDKHRLLKNIDGILYSVTSRHIFLFGKNYTVFYIASDRGPVLSSKSGIQYWNKKDVEDHFFNSFYSITSAIGELQSTIEQMTQTGYPIMILGEEGTGKEQLAKALYTQSPLQNNPFIAIDFSLINDKGWSFLTNHYNSPFHDNNTTIYLKNADKLFPDRQKQLLSSILDMNLCRRNHLLFSCVTDTDGSVPKAGTDFINLLSCLTIHLPPLRKRREDIPKLANLYLSTLNINLAKEILGFKPDALELLTAYEWPYNYTQFKRILSELTIITTSAYITEASVQNLLEKEQGSYSLQIAAPKTAAFNLNRTLDEINQDIIRAVLAETNGNQSAAAKRLGISRTTLWRLLK